jgi:glycolate oxidase iron-sulfur subunit
MVQPQAALATDFSSLDPCVHCGFCLPACPTYLATGDESDSPRGRIVLMRALERGEIAPSDPALLQHLDACLGCRGCEPACPSGVGYGRGLEAARELLAKTRVRSWQSRIALAVFASRRWGKVLFGAMKLLRESGVAQALSGAGRFGFGMGMVAASQAGQDGRTDGPTDSRAQAKAGAHTVRPCIRPTVQLFRGCIMDGLFRHVHDATRRTLEVNGYRVVEVVDQGCCGALHEHAGDRAGATFLARQNLAAFGAGNGPIVVNSAGCGALLKDYGHLLGGEAGASFGARVRDVAELLAARGPIAGARLELDVAYDAPCHLQHAQKVHQPVLALFDAIPGLRLQLLPGYDRCCGSAGIYSLLEPAMSRAVLDDKIAAIAAAVPRPTLLATGNPGCLMQIGAGLRSAGLPIEVVHPVELLDRSYREAGRY